MGAARESPMARCEYLGITRLLACGVWSSNSAICVNVLCVDVPCASETILNYTVDQSNSLYSLFPLYFRVSSLLP